MSKPKRVLVALNIPKHVPDLLVFGQTVVDRMGANIATFPNPNPPLATLKNDLQLLEMAESTAQTKTKGAADARNVKLATVVNDLQYAKAYVQQVADGSPGEAESIIQMAGMGLRKPTLRQKSDFEVRQDEHSGSVQLIAKATRGNAAYQWEQSTDQKTWTPAAITVVSKATVANLTPAVTYFFRFRVTTSTATGEWSQVVSMLVK